MEALVFYPAALVAIVAALVTVTAASPIHSAAGLLAALVALVPVFLLLAGHFVAIVHLLVYAGAIMVLVMFVIMLLDGRPGRTPPEELPPSRALGLALPLALLLFLAGVAFAGAPTAFPPLPPGFGTARGIGELFAGRHLFIFEAVSLLLVVAMAAVVAFTRKDSCGGREPGAPPAPAVPKGGVNA